MGREGGGGKTESRLEREEEEEAETIGETPAVEERSKQKEVVAYIEDFRRETTFLRRMDTRYYVHRGTCE